MPYLNLITGPHLQLSYFRIPFPPTKTIARGQDQLMSFSMTWGSRDSQANIFWNIVQICAGYRLKLEEISPIVKIAKCGRQFEGGCREML